MLSSCYVILSPHRDIGAQLGELRVDNADHVAPRTVGLSITQVTRNSARSRCAVVMPERVVWNAHRSLIGLIRMVVDGRAY